MKNVVGMVNKGGDGSAGANRFLRPRYIIPAAALVGFSAFAIPRMLTSDREGVHVPKERRQKETSHFWQVGTSLTENTRIFLSNDVEQIKARYPPISPKFKYTPGTFEFSAVRDVLQGELVVEMAEKGIPPGNYNIIAEGQYFGNPAGRKIEESAIRYCRLAQQVLAEKIPAFSDLKLEWVGVNGLGIGDDAETDFDKKAFVGKGHFVIQELTSLDPESSERLATVDKRSYDSGGCCLLLDEGDTIFVPANQNGLGFAFSEMLPLKIRTDWKGPYDPLDLRIAEETLTEAEAYHLGVCAVSRSKEIPNEEGLGILREWSDNLPNEDRVLYGLVPDGRDTIGALGQGGIGQAWYMYNGGGPEVFMDAVRSYMKQRDCPSCI